MKKSILFFCSVFLLTTFNVDAARKKPNSSPFYMAIKGGFIDSDAVGDSAVNIGFDVGYRHNAYLSTELELTETIIEGDTPSGNDWNVDTLSVFAAFRSNTEIKLKAKVGLTNINSNGVGDTELSFGIGVGFWAAGGLMEVEYTELDDGLNFYSVGVNYFF